MTRNTGQQMNGIELTDHLGLIGMVATRLRSAAGGAIELEDLYNAGYFGLLRAARKFDPDRGYAFSTYAAVWIRSAVRRTIQDERRTVRIPVHVQDAAWRRREPIPIDALSLDAPLTNEPDSDTWLSLLEGDDDPTANAESIGLIGAVERALSTLPERTRCILRARFWEELTLKQVGERLGLTKERVRQIEADALDELRGLLDEYSPDAAHVALAQHRNKQNGNL